METQFKNYLLYYFIFCSQLLTAQSPVEWTNLYGATKNDVAQSILAEGNNYLLSGYTSSTGQGGLDAWVTKTASDGSEVWSRTYGNPQDNVVNTLAKANDGGYILGGYTVANNTNTLFWLFKINASGTMVWEKTFGGGKNNIITQIVPTSGGYLLLGHTDSPDYRPTENYGFSDAVVEKRDNSGNLIWSKRFGGDNMDIATDLVILSDGKIAVSGYSNSFGNINQVSTLDGWLSILTSSGAWSNTYTYGGSQDDVLNSLVQDGDGNIWMGGYTQSSDGNLSENNGLRDAWIIKVSTSGNLITSKTFGGNQHDFIQTILLQDNKIIAGGSTASTTDNHLGKSDAWLAEFSNTGTLNWSKNYGGNHSEEITDLTIASDEGILMLGFTETNANGDIGVNQGQEDAFIIKLEGDGMIEENPTVSLGSDQSICEGESLDLIPVITNCNTCTYLWNSGQATASLAVSPTTTTTYQLTITNSSGLTATDEVLVTVNPNPSLSISAVSSVCEGQTVSVNTNVTDCENCAYSWNDGNQTANRDILLNTTTEYSLTVTNSQGCSDSESITLTALREIDYTPSFTNSFCGNNNGTITINTNDNIEYDWNTEETTSSLSNLSPGNYILTLSGNGFCAEVQIFSIGNINESVEFSATTTNTSCSNLNNGSVNIEAPSGTSFNWSSGQNTNSINNLSVGEYTVTITNANSCSVTESFTIDSDAEAINYTVSSNDADCASNGSISITTNDLVNFNWSNGSQNASVDNLAPGTYTVTISGEGLCTTTDTYTINNANQNISYQAQIQNTCTNANNGSISIITNDAVNYNWSTGANTASISNLAVGDYMLTLSGEGFCEKLETFTIGSDEPISFSADMFDATCSNNNDGSINLSDYPEGLTFLWNTGQTTSSISNLTPGTYNLTLTGEGYCDYSDSFEVGYELESIDYTFTVNNSLCISGTSGNITITTNDNVSFLWEDGTTNASRNNLAPGIYDLTITGNGFCSETRSFTVVGEQEDLTYTSSLTNSTCATANNGMIQINSEPGAAYIWNTGATTSTINNLSSGEYTLTISATNFCPVEAVFNIEDELSVIEDIETEIAHPDCGNNSGSITITGATSLSYTWNNGTTANSLNNLSEGEYAVTISREGFCDRVEIFSLEDPSDTIIYTANLTPTNCINSSDGAIEINTTQDLSFSWSNGITTNNITDLSTGEYMVTMSGTNLCPRVESFTIDATSNIEIAGEMSPISCPQGADGAIHISATGGVSPYSYEWEDGSQFISLENLSSGNYSVTVTDDLGCTATNDFQLTNPNPIGIYNEIQQESCFGSEDGYVIIGATGGNGGFSYQWSNGATTNEIINLGAGVYNVSIVDALGCGIASSFNISSPDQIIVEPSFETPNNTNSTNGAISLEYSGDYEFLWNTGATTDNISNLPYGIYTVTVTDRLSFCSETFTYSLEVTSSNPSEQLSIFDIYPNPNEGVFSIDLVLNQSTTFNLGLYNQLGQEIWTEEFNTRRVSKSLSLDTLPKGIYYLRYQDGSYTTNKKIIIQ